MSIALVAESVNYKCAKFNKWRNSATSGTFTYGYLRRDVPKSDGYCFIADSCFCLHATKAYIHSVNFAELKYTTKSPSHDGKYHVISMKSTIGLIILELKYTSH